MGAFTIFSSGELATHTNRETYDLVLNCLSNPAGETQTHQPAMNTIPTSYWQFDQQPYDDVVLDSGQPRQILLANSEQPNGEESVPKPLARKAFHNARERDRRQKLNVLYSDLRSLLPKTNSKRKLSIPNTVCRALKYITELRDEIEQLARQRDQLLSTTKPSSEASKSASIEEADFMDTQPALGSSDPPVVRVNAPLGSSELIITICTCRAGFMLSALLFVLEREGLELLNASTFLSDQKVYHNLHTKLNAQRSEVDTNLLKNKLLQLCEKSLQAVPVELFNQLASSR